MRILISLSICLAGISSIIYSYVGAVAMLAKDFEEKAAAGNEMGAIMSVFDVLMSGEVPQLTGFLYVGLLLIAVSVVNFIVAKPKSND